VCLSFLTFTRRKYNLVVQKIFVEKNRVSRNELARLEIKTIATYEPQLVFGSLLIRDIEKSYCQSSQNSLDSRELISLVLFTVNCWTIVESPSKQICGGFHDYRYLILLWRTSKMNQILSKAITLVFIITHSITQLTSAECISVSMLTCWSYVKAKTIDNYLAAANEADLFKLALFQPHTKTTFSHCLVYTDYDNCNFKMCDELCWNSFNPYKRFIATGNYSSTMYR